jgi:succinoglycan biosynthesis protein ExoM
MKADDPHISVCICSYRRPQLLKRLLGELNRQQTEGLFRYSIVVADNDPSESAKSVVSEFRSTASIEMTYCVEPQQNIALARNKALANATGNFIAFIDDDEFPAGDWLLTLFKTRSQYKVDGVLGPVKPYFEQKPPQWILKGKFFERPSHDTGFIIDWTEGRTGNVLFQKRILEGIGEPFKPEFGSGGEDRNFFMRMMERGCVFIWCDEAVAYEVVPPARWKRSFMLRRALLRGKMSLNHKTVARGGIAKSVVAVSLYSAALPFLLLLGHHSFMKYLIKLFDHAGRILAFLGFNPITTAYVTE